MPSFEVEFEVYCGRCGAGLCNQSVGYNRRGPRVDVEPCGKCLENAEDAGYDKGKQEGE